MKSFLETYLARPTQHHMLLPDLINIQSRVSNLMSFKYPKRNDQKNYLPFGQIQMNADIDQILIDRRYLTPQLVVNAKCAVDNI